MRVGDRVVFQGILGVVQAADLTPGMVDVRLEDGRLIRKHRHDLRRARHNPEGDWEEVAYITISEKDAGIPREEWTGKYVALYGEIIDEEGPYFIFQALGREPMRVLRQDVQRTRRPKVVKPGRDVFRLPMAAPERIGLTPDLTPEQMAAKDAKAAQRALELEERALAARKAIAEADEKKRLAGEKVRKEREEGVGFSFDPRLEQIGEGTFRTAAPQTKGLEERLRGAAAAGRREKVKLAKDKSKARSGGKRGRAVTADLFQMGGVGYFTRLDPPRLTSRGTDICGNPIDGVAYYLIVEDEKIWPGRHFLTKAEVEELGLQGAVDFWRGEDYTVREFPISRWYKPGIKIRQATGKDLRNQDPEAILAYEQSHADGAPPPSDAFVQDGKVWAADPKTKISLGQHWMQEHFSPYRVRKFISDSKAKNLSTLLLEQLDIHPKTVDLLLPSGGIRFVNKEGEVSVADPDVKRVPRGVVIETGFRQKSANPFFSWVRTYENVDRPTNYAECLDPVDVERARELSKTRRRVSNLKWGYAKIARLAQADARGEKISPERLQQAVGSFLDALAQYAGWYLRAANDKKYGEATSEAWMIDLIDEPEPGTGKSPSRDVLWKAVHYGFIEPELKLDPDGNQYKTGKFFPAPSERVIAKVRELGLQGPWASAIKYLSGEDTTLNPYASVLVAAKLNVADVANEIRRRFGDDVAKPGALGMWRIIRTPEMMQVFFRMLPAELEQVARAIQASLDIASKHFDLDPDFSAERMKGIKASLDQLPPIDRPRAAEAHQRQLRIEQKAKAEGLQYAYSVLLQFILYFLLDGLRMLGPLDQPEGGRLDKLMSAKAPKEEGEKPSLAAQARALRVDASGLLSTDVASGRLPEKVTVYKTYNPYLFQATRALWNVRPAYDASLQNRPDLLEAIDTIGTYGAAADLVQRVVMLSEDEDEAVDRLERAAKRAKSRAASARGAAAILRSKADEYVEFALLWALGKPAQYAAEILDRLGVNVASVMNVLRKKANTAAEGLPLVGPSAMKYGEPSSVRLIQKILEGKATVAPGDEGVQTRAGADQLRSMLAGRKSFPLKKPATKKQVGDARARIEALQEQISMAVGPQRRALVEERDRLMEVAYHPILPTGQSAEAAALTEFQRDLGLPQTGRYDQPTVQKLVGAKSITERKKFQEVSEFAPLVRTWYKEGEEYHSEPIPEQSLYLQADYVQDNVSRYIDSALAYLEGLSK